VCVCRRTCAHVYECVRECACVCIGSNHYVPRFERQLAFVCVCLCMRSVCACEHLRDRESGRVHQKITRVDKRRLRFSIYVTIVLERHNHEWRSIRG